MNPAPSPSPLSTLECPHCGDVAIEAHPPRWPGDFPGGWFEDGEGGACASCGMPGHVTLDEDEEESDSWIASWSMDDDEDDRCTRPDCEECTEGEQ